MADNNQHFKKVKKEKKKKPVKRTAQNDTALHVFKGAIVSVLGAGSAVTTSVEFQSQERCIFSVVYDGKALVEKDQLAIQEVANKKIQEDSPVECFQMDRAEAEAKYTANLVNHTYIYDKFPVPDSIRTLGLVLIPDWNINCCTGEHLTSIGGVGGIFIEKMKQKTTKKTVDFTFLVGDAALAKLGGAAPATEQKSSKKGNKNKSLGKGQAAQAATPQRSNLVEESVNELINSILKPALANADGDAGQALVAAEKQIRSLLLHVSNTAYTQGFTSKLRKKQGQF